MQRNPPCISFWVISEIFRRLWSIPMWYVKGGKMLPTYFFPFTANPWIYAWNPLVFSLLHEGKGYPIWVHDTWGWPRKKIIIWNYYLCWWNTWWWKILQENWWDFGSDMPQEYLNTMAYFLQDQISYQSHIGCFFHNYICNKAVAKIKLMQFQVELGGKLIKPEI